MAILSSFLLGSFCTIFSFQFLKLSTRIWPYLTSNSKFIETISDNETKRVAIILGGTDGIGK